MDNSQNQFNQPVPSFSTSQLPKTKSKKTLYIIACIVFGLTAFGFGYLIGLDGKSTLEDELQQASQRVDELEEELGEQSRAEDAQSADSGGFFAAQNARARDAKRESDVRSIQTALEAYFTIGNSQYPTLAELNDSTVRSTEFQGLDTDTFSDPNNDSDQLVDTVAANVYAYAPGPAGCDNTTTPCTEYTLTVTLEEGDQITRTNLQ